MYAHRVLFSLWAGLALTLPLAAESLSDIGPPRELPPKGYTQQQYVDSRGCAYLRAGFGNDVRWVPRIGPDKAALCNATPTLKSARAAMADLAAASPAEAAQPAQPAESTQTGARATLTRPALPLDAIPADRRNAGTAPRLAQAGSAPANPAGTVTCTAEAPVLQRVPLVGGGTALLCTAADGRLSGFRPPLFSGTGPQAARQGQTQIPAPARRPAAPALVVPEGYVAAWKDDRLNPLRGVGTEDGQAQQDGLWTRRTPARIVRSRRGETAVQVTAQTDMASAAVQQVAAAPPDPAAELSAGYFVQVGAFGAPDNAERASARLAAAGLPVSLRNGHGLRVVLAGPFADRGAAQAALAQAREAGFAEAFLR